MKILGRIIVFGLAFFLGSQIVSLVSSVWPEIPNIVVDMKLAEGEKAVEPKGIRVMYAGEVATDKDETAYLRFVVYNGTSGNVSYSSQLSEWPSSIIRVNGSQPPQLLHCGDFLESYLIEPGNSAEFRIGAAEFLKVPKRGDLITVGFYLWELGPPDSEFAGVVFSEPFVLSDSFRQVIRQLNKGIEAFHLEDLED